MRKREGQPNMRQRGWPLATMQTPRGSAEQPQAERLVTVGNARADESAEEQQAAEQPQAERLATGGNSHTDHPPI